MSLTNTAIPSPSLLWSFESSNVDTITSLAPSYSTVTTASQYLPSYVSGKYGQAVYFNNQVNYNFTTANSFMVYTVSSGLGITSNNSTYSFWINPQYANLPTSAALKAGSNNILQIIDGATTYKFVTNGFANPGGSNGIFFSGGQNSATSFSPSLQAYNTGSWCHAAVALSNVGARAGTTISYFYFNGVLQGSNTHNIGTTAGTVATLYLGAQTNGVPANAVMGGLFYMDDLRIYNKALYPHQILAIYNLGASPTLSPPPAPNITVYKSSGAPPPVVSYIGSPIFSQISAASSSIGAWSLRALNGVTAKVALIDTYGPFPLYNFTSAAAVTGVALTGQTCTQTFADGTYTATCSTNSGNGGFPQFAFDNNIGTYWEAGGSGSFFYNGTGNYTYSGAQTTTVNGVGVAGDWLQLQSPKSFILTSYSMYARNTFAYRMSNTFVVAGSNDGTTWNQVDSRTGITTWTGQTPITFTTTSTTAFTYFRLITQTIVGNGTTNQTLNIAQWTLNGRAAQDFYADRLGNLTTVPITGQSISSWLGGGTGYIRVLYDQTGSNNFSQLTTVNQPSINLTTTPASITFAPSLYMFRLINFTANPYTLVVSLSAVSAGSNVLTIGTRNWGLYNSTGTTGGLYPGVFSAAEGMSTSATALTASTKTTVAFVSPTPTVYVGGSTVSTTGTFTYSSGQDVVGGNMTLGGGSLTGTFTGQVYECSLFNSSLSASDILKFG